MPKRNKYGFSSRDYEKLYNVWKNMNDRCSNPNSERYYTYGARGIRVCDEWKNDFHAFVDFAVDSGWSPQLSIERMDIDGDYCPENCTFITMREQMRNKTNNVKLTIAGETKCLTEWCEIFGVDFKTVWARYKQRNITDINLLFFKGDLRALRTAVVQLDIDGNVVAEYARLVDANVATGINPTGIGNACKGKTKTSGGYKWMYKGDFK